MLIYMQKGREIAADTRLAVIQMTDSSASGSRLWIGAVIMASSSCGPVDITWEYDRVELIADGIVHAVGTSLGLAGAIAIVILTANSIRAADTLSVVIYTIGLLTMLGFSAAYNLWPISRVKLVLRRFDHSAIYVMIAGTYTPFIAQMKIGLVSMGFLISVWLVAIVGITLKLLLPGRLDRLAVVLYLLLGWSGVMAYGSVFASLPSLTFWLLAAGGVLYSMGVIFHLWRSLRFQNAIWHVFVLLAAVCHYTAVLEYAALARA
jgi:hemolysin III